MEREYPEKFNPDEVAAATVATRYAYGLAPGEIAVIKKDPGAWLERQMDQPLMPAAIASAPGTQDIIAEIFKARQSGRTGYRRWLMEARLRLRDEAAALLTSMLESPVPFQERMVRFWSDHFLLSMNRPAIMPLVSAFEREAIRPNVTRGYYDMMLAIARHPAMLIYLENVRSVGPQSDVGYETGGNVATRMAEAMIGDYTYGPNIYGRDRANKNDIRALARILTGWTIGGPGSPNAGAFVFNERWHEIGKKRFLDVIIPEAGVLEGEAAIDQLVRSNTTAEHLGTKLAVYIGGAPANDQMVTSLEYGYTLGASAGNMARRMARNNLLWDLPQRAYKSPLDLVLSLYRAFGRTDGEQALWDLRAMGQEPWQMPDQDPWPDGSVAWAEKGALAERLAFIEDFAGRTRLPRGMDLIDFGFEILGPLLQPLTWRLLMVARDETEGLSMLLSSPEFMRR